MYNSVHCLILMTICCFSTKWFCFIIQYIIAILCLEKHFWQFWKARLSVLDRCPQTTESEIHVSSTNWHSFTPKHLLVRGESETRSFTAGHFQNTKKVQSLAENIRPEVQTGAWLSSQSSTESMNPKRLTSLRCLSRLKYAYHKLKVEKM